MNNIIDQYKVNRHTVALGWSVYVSDVCIGSFVNETAATLWASKAEIGCRRPAKVVERAWPILIPAKSVMIAHDDNNIVGKWISIWSM